MWPLGYSSALCSGGLREKWTCLHAGPQVRMLRTGERTRLLQGGLQLDVVVLEPAPVDLQLCHSSLEVFQPLSPELLLLCPETRLSLHSWHLQDRPGTLTWPAP